MPNGLMPNLCAEAAMFAVVMMVRDAMVGITLPAWSRSPSIECPPAPDPAGLPPRR